MTWKQFKEAVETLGAKDEDIVDYIDIMGPETIDDIFLKRTEIKDNAHTLTVLGGT